MGSEITLLFEVLATDVADEGSLSSVQPGMSSELTLHGEALAADVADEWSLSSVESDMNSEVPLLSEYLSTDRADEGDVNVRLIMSKLIHGVTPRRGLEGRGFRQRSSRRQTQNWTHNGPHTHSNMHMGTAEVAIATVAVPMCMLRC